MRIKRNFYGSTIKDNGRPFFYDHRFTKFNGFLSWGANVPKRHRKFLGQPDNIRDNGQNFLEEFEMRREVFGEVLDVEGSFFVKKNQHFLHI